MSIAMTVPDLAASYAEWKEVLAKANPGVRIEMVRNGTSPQILVTACTHFGISRTKFARMIGLSSATAERKIKSGHPLGQPETERLGRIALIEDETEKVFGTSHLARDWLTTKNPVLGDTPLSMLDTETGAGEVRKILSAIAFGGVA